MENLKVDLKSNPDFLHDLKLKYDLSYWAEHILGFENPPHTQEWSSLINQVIHGRIERLYVMAPGDHAKLEVFVVNMIFPGTCLAICYALKLYKRNSNSRKLKNGY